MGDAGAPSTSKTETKDHEGGGQGAAAKAEEELVEKTFYTLDPQMHETLVQLYPLFQRKGARRNAGELDQRDCISLLHAIGLNPTTSQLQKFLASAKENEVPLTTKGHITYNNFEQRIGEALRRDPDGFRRHTQDEIAACFQILDPDNDSGSMDPNHLKKLLMEKGDCLTEQEVNDMFRVCKDKDTSKVYSQEYAELAAADGLHEYQMPTSEKRMVPLHPKFQI